MANYLDGGLDADIELLVQTYKDAQDRLLQLIADAQVKGNSTTYYKQVLASVQEELRVLNEYSNDWANEVIPLAYDAGMEQTYRYYRDSNIDVSKMVADNDKVQVYIDNVVDPLQEGVAYIGRRAEDELRQIGLEAGSQASAAGGASKMTRNIFMDALNDAGITSILDRNGRPIDIGVYANMIARTVPREAANAAVLQQSKDIGSDLVQVSTTLTCCEICAIYEGRVYSISGDNTDYPSLMETAFSDGYLNLHPNCFVAGTLVSGPPLLSHIARHYEGEIIVFRTASGEELSVTPNHPILTSKGWINAGLLNKGDKVIKYIGAESFVGNPDYINIPIRIEDIPSTLFKSSEMFTRSVPVAPEDFHGDGSNSKVCIVNSNSTLRKEGDISFKQPRGKKLFSLADIDSSCLFDYGSVAEFFKCVFFPTNSIMSSFCKFFEFRLRHSACSDNASLASALGNRESVFSESFSNNSFVDIECSGNEPFRFTRNVSCNNGFDIKLDSVTPRLRVDSRSEFRKTDASDTKMFFESRLGDADNLSDLFDCLAGHIQETDIVEVESKFFNGHVYNLQTKYNWYVANSIITHNCTHVLEPYVLELDKKSEQNKEASNRPFELTEENKKMLEDYKAQQLVKTQRRNDRNLWEESKLIAPKNTPLTFSAYRSMKRSNSDRYQLIQTEVSKAKDIVDKINIVQ